MDRQQKLEGQGKAVSGQAEEGSMNGSGTTGERLRWSKDLEAPGVLEELRRLKGAQPEVIRAI